MNHSIKILPAAIVMLGLGLGSASFAQNTATPANPTMSANNPAAPDNTMKATAPGTPFSGWMTDYSRSHQGRISRQAYMDEAGRRWDAMDKNNQGLTSDEINRTYGWNASGGSTANSKDKGGK